MEKYIIDLPDEGRVALKCGKIKYRDEMGNVFFNGNISDLTPYTEPDRETIENEVWEFATMLMRMHPDVAEDIYRSMNGGKGIGVAAEMAYSEAKSRYDAWKKEKGEICVGDEVIYYGDKCVVVYVGASEVYHIVDRHWKRAVVQGRFQLTKTGRHFDEVEELLKKMREE